MGKATYIRYFIRNFPSSLRMRLFKKGKDTSSFLGHHLDLESSNEALKEAIGKGVPFAAIRFGATELGALNNHEKIELGFKRHYKKSVRYSMKNNAGYFPTDDESLKRYGDELLPMLKEADILGISGIHMEDYFAKKYLPDSQYILYEAMEPLRGDWTKMLKGKKVLVISPFVEDIAKQYEKRELLFPKDNEILPEFELKLIEAPLTLASEQPKSPSFFDELQKMRENMQNLDFDILLVGAGAYGSFLAIEAKRMGHIGIQTGGATQTLFGILGKRWENREHVAQHVNEHWVRPSRRPQGYQSVESGTYW